MSDRDFLQEAEQNLINVARAHREAIQFLEALTQFGNTYCQDHIGKKEFFEGLQKMRYAICDELDNQNSKLLLFAGVGGEETNEYAREQFKEWFDGDTRYGVMQFLTKNGRSPGWWNAEDEDEFRRQAKEKIRNIKGEE